ncbi:mediator complex, subunit Med21 [Pyronema omphalodes]|nr:mediator complex, subunit Med21 [Pyronema omphalodes]
MTDRLTQLQDAVDQLTTQFFSALRYVGNKHESAPVGTEDRVPDDKHFPDDPAVFESSLSELARDIIVKSKQIEVLITSLPGIGVSEEDQKNRLLNLEQQLKEAEAERLKAVEEKELARERLESVIVKLRRI